VTNDRRPLNAQARGSEETMPKRTEERLTLPPKRAIDGRSLARDCDGGVEQISSPHQAAVARRRPIPRSASDLKVRPSDVRR